MKKWTFLMMGLGVLLSSAQMAEGKGGTTSSVVKPEELITPVNYAPEFTLPKGSRRCTDAESKKIYDVFKSSLKDFIFEGGQCFKISKVKYNLKILEQYAFSDTLYNSKRFKKTNLLIGSESLIFADDKDFYMQKNATFINIVFYTSKNDSEYQKIISMGALVSVDVFNRVNLQERFKEIKW